MICCVLGKIRELLSNLPSAKTKRGLWSSRNTALPRDVA